MTLDDKDFEARVTARLVALEERTARVEHRTALLEELRTKMADTTFGLPALDYIEGEGRLWSAEELKSTADLPSEVKKLLKLKLEIPLYYPDYWQSIRWYSNFSASFYVIDDSTGAKIRWPVVETRCGANCDVNPDDNNYLRRFENVTDFTAGYGTVEGRFECAWTYLTLYYGNGYKLGWRVRSKACGPF